MIKTIIFDMDYTQRVMSARVIKADLLNESDILRHGLGNVVVGLIG